MEVESLLVVTVGLPYSGKSVWSSKQGVPIVCPDEIRYALHGCRYLPLAEPFVWAIAMVMVRALFGAGHEKVVVDATNMTRKRRDFWQSDEWATAFKVFTDPRDVCYRRAEVAQDETILPIIDRMASEWEALGTDEIQCE